ncbi:MAG: ATP-binding cassette domain-containing protein [candidate division Zixibacteria bacterium]|nr:ATP-binding cassette domain-containing protein [candidate division Zixibacteria bacterium]
MDTVISIEDVAKSFGEKKVLNGVNIDVRRGESLVIIGRSGCGKSVLLKHIVGLIHPDRGTVRVFDKDMDTVKGKELAETRKKIGMLFQSAALLDSLSVAENVGLGLREARHYPEAEIERIIEEKLEMVGMAGTGEIYPSELSGGMRKRVGLARAIATDPEILLYDEPTTGLDPITADIINDLINDFRSKLSITSVSVTHDMKAAYKTADRIVMLHDGVVEYEGTPEQIKNSGNAVVDQFISGRADGPIQIT